MDKDQIKQIVKETVNEMLKCPECYGNGMIKCSSSGPHYVNGHGESFVECVSCSGTGFRLKFSK